MNILALETATENCSVALLVGNEILQRERHAPQQHTRLILPFIDSLLAEAGLPKSRLDAVAFGRGPGSFTGIRIALAIAQGIGLGLDIPLLPVSTLAALAMGANADKVYAALDARLEEVYCGTFVQDLDHLVSPSSEEAVISPVQAPLPVGLGWYGAGSGWARHGNQLATRLGERLAGMDASVIPQARSTARLAQRDFTNHVGIDPAAASPVYLRNRVTHGQGTDAIMGNRNGTLAGSI